MEAQEHLQQISLFKSLPPHHMAALAGIAKRVQFVPGQRLVAQGDLGNRFIIVDKGLVNLRRTDADGIERSVGVVSPHPLANNPQPHREYFGEQMFTTQEPFEFHADAVRPTEAIIFARDDFANLIKERPAILPMLGFVQAAERKRTRGYVWVSAGESVEMVERKHWWALLPGMIPVVVLTLITLIVLFILHFVLVPDQWGWAAVISSVIVLGVLAWQVYDWSNDEYIVTTQRAAHVERIFLNQELRESVPIDKVLGVTLHREFPSVYLGVSTVVIQTAGREQGDVTFAYVANGEKIRNVIQSQQDRVRAQQAAQEREGFRLTVRQELRQFLMPEQVAAERAAEETAAPPPPPRRSKSTRDTIQSLVRAALVLELKEPGRVTWRKHWIVLARQSGQWWIALLIFDVIAYFFAVNQGIQLPGYWLGGLVALLILLGGLAWQWEDWRNDIYAVTDTMVIDTEALPFGFRSKSTVAPLDQVQNIRVEIPSMMAYLLNYGDVKIETAGKSGQMIFFSIHNPRDAQEEIFRRMEAFRKRRAEKEASLRSRAVVDALVAYDRLKTEQETPSPASSADTPPASQSAAE